MLHYQVILKCVEQGFAILPLKSQSKVPAVKGGVTVASKNRKKVEDYFRVHPNLNFGIATGKPSGIFVLDVDGPEGEASLGALVEKHGRLPETATVETRNGCHLYFRSMDHVISTSAGKLGPGIDVRGDGGYVVGPGSTHPSGEQYKFRKGLSFTKKGISKPPVWLLDLVRKAPSAPAAAVTDLGKLSDSKRRQCERYVDAVRVRELERLKLAPVGRRNGSLNKCAFRLGQLLHLGILKPQAVATELTTCGKTIGLDSSVVERTVASGLKAGERHPDFLRLLRPNRTERVPQLEVDPDGQLTAELAQLGEEDADNARRFVRRFGHEFAYTPGRGWLVYDGRCWTDDRLGVRMRRALKTVHLIKDEARHVDNEDAQNRLLRMAKAAKSRRKIEDMLALAANMLTVDDKAFDNDPWLLNVVNGTIDLRTGFRYRHDPRDLITRLAPVRRKRNAKCPTFRRFLQEVTGGDTDFEEFLQRAIGYSLTGDTSEQVLFFVHGPGKTGKSTFVNLIRAMLGGYGRHTPTETLLAKFYDNAIPSDLARLNGARMVTAVEANFNRQLDEAKIKGMTGGEPIVARFLRHEYFEFTPEFKLWLVANDFPRVRGTAEAFWRRIRVLPFVQEVEDDQLDHRLPDKLRNEWSGILNWAVSGAKQWFKDGLGQPKTIGMATKAWREVADHVALFVTEEVIVDTGKRVASADMFARYCKWCHLHGEQPLSMAKLKGKLITMNYTFKRTKRGREWHDLRLRPE